jgi:hypothetical protein
MQAGKMEQAMEVVKLEGVRKLLQFQLFAKDLLKKVALGFPNVIAQFSKAWSIFWAGLCENIFDLWQTLKYETAVIIAQIGKSFAVVQRSGKKMNL